MIEISRRRRTSQGGNYMLEMGLCMTVLFLIMFGIIEWSRIAYTNNFCAFAAQQGARYASIHGSSSAAPLTTSPSPCGTSCTNASTGDATTTYLQGYAVGLDVSKMTVATSWSSSTGNGNAAGGTVTVKVTYAYNPFLTIVAPLPSTFNMNSTSTMTVLQ